MDFRDRVLGRVASQLGQPRGLPGRVIGRMLNRANKNAIIAAVDALDVPPDAMLADLGFGGGIGLGLLLGRIGRGGQVHGVERSTTMLAAAAHRYRNEIATGRLALHEAPIERLPLATSSVDGAITMNTIYFISDLAGALGECARVLKPSGQLVIGLGDPANMARSRLTAHGFHVRPLTEITNALRATGLEVDQHRPIGSGKHPFHLLVAQPY